MISKYHHMKAYDIQFEDGAAPQSHEIQTALFLKKHGKKITFLAPKNQNRIKTPDIKMDGKMWEIKSPVSTGSRTIEAAFRQALKQAENIIFDLRRSKANDSANISKINKQIGLISHKKLKRVIVITKAQEILDINNRPSTIKIQAMRPLLDS